MKRRDFFHLTLGALVAQAAMSRRGFAQAPGSGTLKVDIYSRHLQWLRTAEDVADAALEMGYDGVNVTVRPYPGHVDPDKVATELPPFVGTLRKRGLLVRSITTNIADADPTAERIVAAASSLGITHYWWGTYRYDLTKAIEPQLEALKPRVAKIAALSEKYKMTAAYHTYSMPATVGSVMWDLLSLLRAHDPRFVGFHYDTGHEAHHINGLWEVNLRAAGPYIAALAVKDYAPEQAAPGARGDGGPGGPAGRGTPGQTGGDASRGGPTGRGARGGGNADPGAGNGWRTGPVPLGMGLVDLPRIATALKDIHFAGPIEIQAEYPNGGADNASDSITLPRSDVLGAMKRDLLTLRRGFAPSGLL
jgi:sugar phosphate isomerase/epimerase